MIREKENPALTQEEVSQNLLQTVRILRQLCGEAGIDYRVLVLDERVVDSTPCMRPDINMILETVAVCYGVPVSGILGPCRKRTLVMARQTCCYVMYYWGYKVVEIGTFMGIKHSTVSVSCGIIRGIIQQGVDQYFPQVVKSFKLIHNHYGRKNVIIHQAKN